MKLTVEQVLEKYVCEHDDGTVALVLGDRVGMCMSHLWDRNAVRVAVGLLSILADSDAEKDQRIAELEAQLLAWQNETKERLLRSAYERHQDQKIQQEGPADAPCA